jgi:hypothetical protein
MTDIFYFLLLIFYFILPYPFVGARLCLVPFILAGSACIEAEPHEIKRTR